MSQREVETLRRNSLHSVPDIDLVTSGRVTRSYRRQSGAGLPISPRSPTAPRTPTTPRTPTRLSRRSSLATRAGNDARDGSPRSVSFDEESITRSGLDPTAPETPTTLRTPTRRPRRSSLANGAGNDVRDGSPRIESIARPELPPSGSLIVLGNENRVVDAPDVDIQTRQPASPQLYDDYVEDPARAMGPDDPQASEISLLENTRQLPVEERPEPTISGLDMARLTATPSAPVDEERVARMEAMIGTMLDVPEDIFDPRTMRPETIQSRFQPLTRLKGYFIY